MSAIWSIVAMVGYYSLVGGDHVAKYRRSKYVKNLQKIEPDLERFIAYLRGAYLDVAGSSNTPPNTPLNTREI